MDPVGTTEAPPINPLEWIGAERSVLTAFADTQAQAVKDLDTSIADFQEKIDDCSKAEVQFTSDLATIAGSLNSNAIQQTLAELVDADVKIVAKFEQLEQHILQNNKNAKVLADALVQSQDTIQQVAASRTAIAGKIDRYNRVINTFRSYKK